MKPSNILLIIILLIVLLPFPGKEKVVEKIYDCLPYVGYSSCLANDSSVETPDSIIPMPLCGCAGTKLVKTPDGIKDIPCPCGKHCTCQSPDDKPIDEQTQGCKCGCGRRHCKCHKAAGACPVGVAEPEEKPIFYTAYFTAPWCGPCQTFNNVDKPKLKDWKWGKKYTKGVNVVVTNIEEDPVTFANVLRKFREKGINIETQIPTFVVMKNGEPIAFKQGYMTYLQFAEFHNSTIEANR